MKVVDIVKNVLKNILLISLLFSFVFLIAECIKYSDRYNRISSLKNEYYVINDELSDIYTTISNLKLEKENISEEKKDKLKVYKKWEEQNKILEDLLK